MDKYFSHNGVVNEQKVVEDLFNLSSNLILYRVRSSSFKHDVGIESYRHKNYYFLYSGASYTTPSKLNDYLDAMKNLIGLEFIFDEGQASYDNFAFKVGQFSFMSLLNTQDNGVENIYNTLRIYPNLKSAKDAYIDPSYYFKIPKGNLNIYGRSIFSEKPSHLRRIK